MGIGLNPGCNCCDCVACSTVQFEESFDSPLVWPDTWTDETCGGLWQPVFTGFYLPGDNWLRSSNPASAPYASAARQSKAWGNWSCLSIECMMGPSTFGPPWSTMGIYLAGARNFYARAAGGYGRNEISSNDACSNAGTAVTFGSAFIVHSTLKMILRQGVGGYGYWNIQYCVDDVLEYEETNVALTLNDPLYFGLFWTFASAPSGGGYLEFNDFKFKATA